MFRFAQHDTAVVQSSKSLSSWAFAKELCEQKPKVFHLSHCRRSFAIKFSHPNIPAESANMSTNKLKMIFIWFNIWRRSCGYQFCQCFFHKFGFVFYKDADVYHSPFETPYDIHRMPLYIKKLVWLLQLWKNITKRHVSMIIFSNRTAIPLLFFFFELPYRMWVIMKKRRRR
jgi:hypothetical protein